MKKDAVGQFDTICKNEIVQIICSTANRVANEVIHNVDPISDFKNHFGSYEGKNFNISRYNSEQILKDEGTLTGEYLEILKIIE